MNVALLVLTTEWGGAEGHTLQLARLLMERGHSATVVCLTELSYKLYRERNAAGVSVICLPTPKGWQEMGLNDWLDLLAGQTWDTCILAKGAFEIGGWALDLAARYRFRRYLTIEHLCTPLPPKPGRPYLGFIPRPRWRWYPVRFQGLLRSICPTKVICVSEAGRQRLIEDFYFSKRKVVTVHNGIDVERFRPNADYGRKWRRIWGIPEKALVFGAVGRLSPRKKYDVALNSFRNLVERFPDQDLRLVLVGEGPHETALRAEAARLDLSNHVIFSPFMSQPWEPLNAIDIFVMPSMNEGLPLALVEAMACGCCSVATAVGGIPEVVNRPEVGWLVPPGDMQSFTTAMIDAASRTPSQLRTMGRLARERVLEAFDAGQQFSVLTQAIESLEKQTSVANAEVRRRASGDIA